jgi:S-DNA-T family DNA segregation ATPase FtsK/SpoIIIE
LSVLAGEPYLSQEYTEDKEVTLTKLSSGRRLLEALLILVSLFAVWLMAALLSFNPSDPSWSQTAWHEPIHNLGGARSVACGYAILHFWRNGLHHSGHYHRRLLVCLATSANDEYIDFAVSLRLIGALALILTPAVWRQLTLMISGISPLAA